MGRKYLPLFVASKTGVEAMGTYLINFCRTIIGTMKRSPAKRNKFCLLEGIIAITRLNEHKSIQSMLYDPADCRFKIASIQYFRSKTTPKKDSFVLG